MVILNSGQPFERTVVLTDESAQGLYGAWRSVPLHVVLNPGTSIEGAPAMLKLYVQPAGEQPVVRFHPVQDVGERRYGMEAAVAVTIRALKKGRDRCIFLLFTFLNDCRCRRREDVSYNASRRATTRYK